MPRCCLLLLLALGAALFAGCGSGSARSGGVTVVATTTQVADLVRNVGGGDVAVERILAPNTDPHEYEVRPHDVRRLAGAGVVVRSGGDVDDWLTSAIGASGTHAPVLTLIDHVARRDDDPHWWQDPRNAQRAVVAIRDALIRADAAHAAGYRERARAYSARIARLDRSVAGCLARVPAARRRLVTSHDSLGYYARRYGIDVLGTVIPSRSTAGQPSAGEIAALVAAIRRSGVTAIFAESSVNPKVEQAIADEAGAHVGRALWADTLGPPGSSGATYLGSIAANTRALVEGFTGGRQTCALPD